MTLEQYERWKDFAIRMARTAFSRKRKPSGRDITEMVEEFFADIEDGGFGHDMTTVICILDWDSSNPYPKGHPYRELKRTFDCWCHTESKVANPDCRVCHGTGRGESWAKPPCIADFIAESFHERWILDYWGRHSEAQWERLEDRWAGPPTCCIRAGLDIAVAPSAGVAGFTAGDIRRMYPEGVPDWVARAFDEDEIIEVAGVIPGVGFVPKPTGRKAPRFEELKDTDSLWL